MAYAWPCLLVVGEWGLLLYHHAPQALRLFANQVFDSHWLN